MDEIGDLPMPVQPKLLRFIQEREYERVGDHITRKANVRIIAATNLNLEQLVRKDDSRQDLFYRLNVVPITVAKEPTTNDTKTCPYWPKMCLHLSAAGIVGVCKGSLMRL